MYRWISQSEYVCTFTYNYMNIKINSHGAWLGIIVQKIDPFLSETVFVSNGKNKLGTDLHQSISVDNSCICSLMYFGRKQQRTTQDT